MVGKCLMNYMGCEGKMGLKIVESLTLKEIYISLQILYSLYESEVLINMLIIGLNESGLDCIILSKRIF